MKEQMLKKQTEKDSCTDQREIKNEGQIREKINTLEHEVEELSAIISNLTNRLTPILESTEPEEKAEPQTALMIGTQVSLIEKFIIEISDTVMDCRMRLMTLTKKLRI